MAWEPEDPPPALNGVPLTGLDAVREALDYLTDDYNDGDLIEAENGRCLIAISRTRRFGNYTALRDAPALELFPAAIDVGDEEPDIRLKVEIREVGA